MRSRRFCLVLAFALTASAKHLTIQLTRREDDLQSHAAHAYVKRAAASLPFVVAPESLPPTGAFWHGSFDVGASKNLSLLIDTGTNFIEMSPDVYKPGPDSIVLNQTHPDSFYLNESHWAVFDQTEKNGCGELATRYDGYVDTISFQGLTAKHQRFGVSSYVELNRSNVITQLPSRTFSSSLYCYP